MSRQTEEVLCAALQNLGLPIDRSQVFTAIAAILESLRKNQKSVAAWVAPSRVELITDSNFS
jgi:hypothetical protein